MVGMEQRLTVCKLAVRRQFQIDQISYSTRSSTPHSLLDSCQLTQVIIDNGLAGNRKDIAIGRKSDGYAAVTGSDIFVFSSLRNLFQLRKAIQAHTFCFMEVRQGTFFSPPLESLTAVLPAREYGLFSPTS